MGDSFKLDNNIIMKNVDSFTFNDKKEVYTNGADLIPVFRVEQIIESMKLQELVDKATPKKPKINHYDNDCTKIICPNDCGIQLNGLNKDNEITSFTHEYCPKCGQAIDWSTDE